MNRAIVLGALVAAGAVSIAFSASRGRLAAAAAQTGDAVIEKVRDNLYVVTTGGPTRTNVTFFITEKNGVVMFDTGDPGWGRAWLAALKKITDKPLTTILISHTHSDHTGSIPEMGHPLVRVAHENAKAGMAQATCPPLTSCQLFQGENARYLPTRTFKDTLTMFGGNDRVDLYHFGRSHTNGDAVFVIPSLGVLLTGDMFAWRGVPRVYVDDGGSMLEYPRTLTRLTSTIEPADTVINGHSILMKWADLLEFRSFVQDYTNYVTGMHKARKSVNETVAGAAGALAKYRPCDPRMERAAELQKIDCRFRMDQTELNTRILYDELEGRVSKHGSEQPR